MSGNKPDNKADGNSIGKQPAEQNGDYSNAIAIIGMAGRFPKAEDVDALWNLLLEGKEAVTFFTEDELLAAGVEPELIHHPNYVPARAYLEDPEGFDAAFFGYSPREAQVIDPQQRIFLECAYTALEMAGYDAERYPGLVGVFGGQGMNTYLMANVLANPEAIATAGMHQIMISNDKDFLATRVSYKLNLKGPSLSVQTACSSALVAVHTACQNLLAYQCDMALAGGVSVQPPSKTGYLYQPGMIMSPDGRCHAFDARAQGLVGGEGVGVVALKRLADAVADRDTIHAVIRGSAINNDGSLKVGFTAPSVDGQTEVILMAQAVSDVEPRSITYVEAHGTGTELGDPVEVSALTQAFRTGTQDKGFCALASLKTNVGHLDAASGVASLIKATLALKHKMLPASLNYEKPNPRIDFENSPFYVNAQRKAWDTDRLPRRAGVSAYGIGGTNAHVVLEEAPPQPPLAPAHPEQLLVFSARSDAALNTMLERFSTWLKKNPHTALSDASYTLQAGRKVFAHRAALVCANTAEAIAILDDPQRLRLLTAAQERRRLGVTFLFPGEGAQRVGMGRSLYECEPAFRALVDECSLALRPHLGLNLGTLLYPAPELAAQAERQLAQTHFAQPALFVVEYALAKLLMEWGIQPTAMMGDGIGELAAATVAGVFSLEDGLALAAARGRILQDLPAGGLLEVALKEEDLSPLLNGQLSLAGVDAPGACRVCGPQDELDAFQAALTDRRATFRRVDAPHAVLAAAEQVTQPAFAQLLAGLRLNPPKLRFLSNSSGGWIRPEQATDPAYWAAQPYETARLSQNLEAAFAEPSILLEVGPGQALGALALRQPRKPADLAALATLDGADGRGETAALTTALARLWLAGVIPDWQAYHAASQPRRVALPTYPFEHKRFWLEPKQPTVNLETAAVLTRSGAEHSGAVAGVSGVGAAQADTAGRDGRSAAQREASARPDLQSAYAPPTNEVEQRLVTIWENFIGIEPIGIHDNFFELGGHSLMAAQILARVQDFYRINLPMREFFETTTIVELAQRIETLLWIEQNNEAAPIDSEDREEFTL